MAEADAFFRKFGALDEHAYEDGAIGKKHKELTGLVITVAIRCDKCIVYHLDGCAREEGQRLAIETPWPSSVLSYL